LSVGDSRFSDQWRCDACDWDGDMDAAIGHARANYGHAVTEQLPEGGPAVEMRVPAGVDFPVVDGPLPGMITRPGPVGLPASAPREITRN
jgi:hypothetical protein